nr:ClassD_beta_lactamase [uncultured bacterium]
MCCGVNFIGSQPIGTALPIQILFLMKLSSRIFLSLFACLFVCTPIQAQDLSKFFKNTTGAFVLYDLKNDRYLRHNPTRCRQRFSPYSTFKIPNSLIGLDTKVIADADYLIRWDQQIYPAQSGWIDPPFVYWKQDHTLRSAIKYSVVWYYRELAKRVGEQQMKKYVSAFSYGNQDISGGLSSPNLFEAFWLNSSLRISADEQIEFLKRFYTGKLPVAERSTNIVKDILVLEKTDRYTLSGKTGGGSLRNGKSLGWFVGYVETNGNVYFFATNIEGANYAAIRDRRIDLTKQILRELGYLPKQ